MAPHEKGPLPRSGLGLAVFKQTLALWRCDTGELDADVIGRRAVLDGFAVNAIRVGSFHPNVDVNGNALVANTSCNGVSVRSNRIITARALVATHPSVPPV